MILFAKDYYPTWDQDLFRDWRFINNTRSTFTINKPGYLFVDGRMDTHHRGIIDEAVMVAFDLRLNGVRFAPYTGENIINETDHYASSFLLGFAELEPGTHKVEVFGRSASTAAPNTDGLAEIKSGYCILRVRVDERI